jgi:hypothetical protein
MTRRQDRRAELNAIRALNLSRTAPSSQGLTDVPSRDRETAAAGLVKGETACNRSACQAPLIKDARWWNASTQAFYCKSCALRINESAPNLCKLESA